MRVVPATVELDCGNTHRLESWRNHESTARLIVNGPPSLRSSNNYAALRSRRTANDPDLILIHLNHDLIWLPDEASVQMALGRPAIVQNPTPGSSKVARWLCYDKVYQLMGWLWSHLRPNTGKIGTKSRSKPSLVCGLAETAPFPVEDAHQIPC